MGQRHSPSPGLWWTGRGRWFARINVHHIHRFFLNLHDGLVILNDVGILYSIITYRSLHFWDSRSPDRLASRHRPRRIWRNIAKARSKVLKFNKKSNKRKALRLTCPSVTRNLGHRIRLSKRCVSLSRKALKLSCPHLGTPLYPKQLRALS
ncbi:hypothetical protein AMTR_s00020p00162260 [Amborella trichopoda]|uniref:Uncharacterized protein n=1 Tax=Amborella trichopoda TaxID=13333 RepID=W1PWV8_AMBTC|nr:hypothetical protein AMTR_s00020p00162260 [Amborella trichopoda]